ncbi:hypothetical protein C8R46DRAFT_277518 [Mycena filopes]|nr:hypothetical protein C8R46DRAFT_277518 [Mycena filopes]
MSSPVSSLTASRSPSPEAGVVQPDHFYGAEGSHLPPSPDSEGKTYLTPEDDPLAHRGIPVFKPSMDEFADFEGYMTRVECWGRRSGIVKIVPPPEWTAALPDVTPQLGTVKIKSPIEQFMRGRAGLFRQENVEKRKLMSVREWAELCAKPEFRAPGKSQVGLHNNPSAQPALRSRRKKVPSKAKKYDDDEDETTTPAMASPPNSASPDPEDAKPAPDSKPRNRRIERADKDASFLDSFTPHTDWLPPDTVAADYTPEFCAKLERAFWRNCGLGKPAWYGADTMGSLFTPRTSAWNVATLPSLLTRLLPASTGLPGVNTPYLYFGMWRATFAWHVEDMDLFSINYIHFGAPKFWYAVPQGRAGALEDTMRGYFPKDTSTCPQFLRHKSFLASPTLLSQSAVRPNHLVQHAGEFVVTFPRGYHAGFNLGLNCAESVNFALESWLDEGRKASVCGCVDYSVRIDVDQLLEDRRIDALELTDPAAAAQARAVRDGLFPDGDDLTNPLDVDMPVVTLTPASTSSKGKAKSTGTPTKTTTASTPVPKPRQTPRKRKPTAPFEPEGPAPKRVRTATAAPTHHAHASGSGAAYVLPTTHQAVPPKITLKIGPRPAGLSSHQHSSSHHHSSSGYQILVAHQPQAIFPCCLCVSPARGDLLRVHDLPAAWRELGAATEVHYPSNAGGKGVWMAHEGCAVVLPETWVDEIVVGGGHGQERKTERVVFGVDGVERARWSLKCAACTAPRSKSHGALIQCAKGKCPKAFHINCARAGADAGTGIAYKVVREVEKEVVLLEPAPTMGTNSQDAEPNLRVLKVIRKTEVEALCAQHNPVIVASRRASKAESLRADVLALPPLSRIKIRVSSGVFEVTLMRVVEDRRAVEVLWDAGEVREVKWANIVMGMGVGPEYGVVPDPNLNNARRQNATAGSSGGGRAIAPYPPALNEPTSYAPHGQGYASQYPQNTLPTATAGVSHYSHTIHLPARASQQEERGQPTAAVQSHSSHPLQHAGPAQTQYPSHVPSQQQNQHQNQTQTPNQPQHGQPTQNPYSNYWPTAYGSYGAAKNGTYGGAAPSNSPAAGGATPNPNPYKTGAYGGAFPTINGGTSTSPPAAAPVPGGGHYPTAAQYYAGGTQASPYYRGAQGYYSSGAFQTPASSEQGYHGRQQATFAVPPQQQSTPSGKQAQKPVPLFSVQPQPAVSPPTSNSVAPTQNPNPAPNPTASPVAPASTSTLTSASTPTPFLTEPAPTTVPAPVPMHVDVPPPLAPPVVV